MRALAAGLLLLAPLQDRRVALVPSFELARSRHGVELSAAIDPAKLLRIESDGTIRAGGRLLAPAVEASTPETDLVAPLHAWMLELARSMPIDPDDPLAVAELWRKKIDGAVRNGVLRIEAHRDAPAERVLLALEACTPRSVLIPRVDLAVEGAEGPRQRRWLRIGLLDRGLAEEFADGAGGRILLEVDHEPMHMRIGPMDAVELAVRASADGEPRLEYELGPWRTDALEKLGTRARAVREENPTWPWFLWIDGDLRWQEVLRVLDVLRDSGIAPCFDIAERMH